jgi:hypothetical protein
MYKLIDQGGKEVVPGTKIKDFRGDTWEVINFRYNGGNSEGRVAVMGPRGGIREFYPSVFELKIKEQ